MCEIYNSLLTKFNNNYTIIYIQYSLKSSYIKYYNIIRISHRQLTSINNDWGIKQNKTQNEMLKVDIKFSIVLFDIFCFPFYSFNFFFHPSLVAYIYVSNGDFFLFFWVDNLVVWGEGRIWTRISHLKIQKKF